MKWLSVATLGLTWLAAGPAVAEWRSDPNASTLDFVPTYDGQDIPGTFHSFLVRTDLDPDRPAGASLDVRVNVASADMDDEDINTEIATPVWFSSDRFPEAHFFSDYILPAEDGFTARGRLRLKGAEREITVPFTFAPNAQGALMEGEVRLDRSDFDIGSGTWADDDTIGFAVTVTFSVQLIEST